MFEKTEFTPEELKQVEYVNDKLNSLRSYAKRYDAGEKLDNDELQEVVNDILDNVVPVAERFQGHTSEK